MGKKKGRKLDNLKGLEMIDKQVNKIVKQMLKVYAEQNLSYDKISEMSGVSEPTICNIFAGRRKASIYTFMGLANALGLEIIVREKIK